MIPEAGFYQPEVRLETGGHLPLSEELLVMKKKVVPFLINHPYSGPFRYPVNAKAEGIYPDYFKVGRATGQSFVLPISFSSRIIWLTFLCWRPSAVQCSPQYWIFQS